MRTHLKATDTVSAPRLTRLGTQLLLVAASFACHRQPPYGIGEPWPATGGKMVWFLRASDTKEEWIAVGDTLDMVILHEHCPLRPSGTVGGCNLDTTTRAAPLWRIGNPRLARIEAHDDAYYLMYRGAAGARVRALQPGRTYIEARLRIGALATDLLVVPPTDHIRIEPRDTAVTKGDTIWGRLTARDAAGGIVAVLEWPDYWGAPVGPTSRAGFTPIAAPENADSATLHFRLGARVDTVIWHFLPRR